MQRKESRSGCAKMIVICRINMAALGRRGLSRRLAFVISSEFIKSTSIDVLAESFRSLGPSSDIIGTDVVKQRTVKNDTEILVY